MWKLSFSILLCLIVGSSVAQQIDQPPKDTLRTYRKPAKPDSLRIKFYPRAVRVGTDVITMIKTRTVDSFRGWEVNGDIDCGKYYFAVDVGSWGRTYDSIPSGSTKDNGTYQNNGMYWRIGMDVNLLTKDPDKNMFFFGFRYGRSTFSESTNFLVKDPVFGDYRLDLSNPRVTAGWAELTAGLRVKIVSNFWMGFTSRMKFAPKTKGDDAFKTYDIPGYGVYSESLYWGFNYQVFWQFPFKK